MPILELMTQSTYIMNSGGQYHTNSVPTLWHFSTCTDVVHGGHYVLPYLGVIQNALMTWEIICAKHRVLHRSICHGG